MTAAEPASDLKLATDTPYLALKGKLWGVCCEEIGENWQRYNGTALYMGINHTDSWEDLEVMLLLFSSSW